jgi:hypothetical protein
VKYLTLKVQARVEVFVRINSQAYCVMAYNKLECLKLTIFWQIYTGKPANRITNVEHLTLKVQTRAQAFVRINTLAYCTEKRNLHRKKFNRIGHPGQHKKDVELELIFVKRKNFKKAQLVSDKTYTGIS